MIEKEIGELRRRLRPGKNNMNHIFGCYVSAAGEIITEFDESTGLMPEDEAEKYFGMFRRSMSGKLGRTLTDITFATSQVADSPEHRLLMQLRDPAQRPDALKQFYETVIPAVHFDENYVIMVTGETYDVPFHGKDGSRFDDSSEDQFTYMICAICPVKLTKSMLSYQLDEAGFHNSHPDYVMSAPEIGFLFPAFDSRKTNIYNALYYSRDLKNSQEDFVNAVFHTEAPMPAAFQKETFEELLSDTLDNDCSMDVLQSVHARLSDIITEHKESKDPEPLLLSGSQMKAVLEDSGVSESHAEHFAEQFEAQYGEQTDVSPANLVDTKHFEVKTPDVVITVNPEVSSLLQTRIINGTRYILIAAEDGVEVNGVPIVFEEPGQENG